MCVPHSYLVILLSQVEPPQGETAGQGPRDHLHIMMTCSALQLMQTES
jgi:hypothetical protein